MNELNNVVTIGEIIADYMRRLEVRRELEKLLFSGDGSPEACASQYLVTSRGHRAKSDVCSSRKTR